MARIRSIKPEFFTSETLVRVPKSARLTFIGLWTYVDDNGVGLDNERLIAAALYPLDEDFIEELEEVADDLRNLERVGVIQRYTVAGKRYVHVTAWDEHQKVSHPGKPRYPLPPEDYGTPPAERATDSGNPPEELPQPSGESPETLRPEIGAGSRELSREQGAGKHSAGLPTQPPLLVVLPTQPLAPLAESPPSFEDFYAAYPRRVGVAKARTAYESKIKNGADPRAILAATCSYADRCRLLKVDKQYIPHPTTWLNRESWADDLDEAMPLPPAARGAAEQRLTEGLERDARMRALDEQAAATGRPPNPFALLPGRAG